MRQIVRQRSWVMALLMMAVAARDGRAEMTASSGDSVMRVNVQRDDMGKQVTLELVGVLRANAGAVSTFRVAVFPDEATAAKARSNDDGSLFSGELSLGRTLVTRGGFTGGPFVVQSPRPGEFEARTSGTLLIHVRVPDSELAVVRSATGPLQAQTVPAASSLGFALTSMGLLAIGARALRRRRTPAIR